MPRKKREIPDDDAEIQPSLDRFRRSGRPKPELDGISFIVESQVGQVFEDHDGNPVEPEDLGMADASEG